MKRKVLTPIMVVLGLSIMIYPTFRDYYYEFQQQKIISLWQDNLLQISEDSIEAESSKMSQSSIKSEAIQAEAIQGNGKGSAALSYDLTQEMEALLIIDKINLRLPVLTGVNERNLNLAAASIENTGKPGQIGNYGIAGHRSRTYGVLFNRLDELQKGDAIVIETPDHRYTYQVTDRFIVKPDDVHVLRGDGQKEQVTLVTCDYSSKPYLRLIVQGELQLGMY